ncbi:MAG: hypothetical protein QOC81_105 [Thermoanaerobaculia bacterium]|nr:hypothetical protein [Thermoanaerobaculia bacterium]
MALAIRGENNSGVRYIRRRPRLVGIGAHQCTVPKGMGIWQHSPSNGPVIQPPFNEQRGSQVTAKINRYES